LSKNIASGTKLFSERKWVYGGDTRIWIDGNAPHGEKVKETAKWLNENYDAVFFSFICPHPCKTCPEPIFLNLYKRLKIPMLTTVPDGYWDKYAEWGKLCFPYLKAVVTLMDSYAATLPESLNAHVIPVPFLPIPGKPVPRSEEPLIAWTNQWKNIKGITEFLSIVPELDESIQLELYSSGIRYYQLRTTEVWKNAVGQDTFTSKYSGHGRGTYYANVDLHEIARVYQRAWFTCSLQGMKTNKKAYKKGSYNNAEVEALFYGACPILHESTLNAGIPEDCFLPVASEKEIPDAIHSAIKSGFAIDPERQQRARRYVCGRHWASKKYQELKQLIVS
jgi:hypothetical protein